MISATAESLSTQSYYKHDKMSKISSLFEIANMDFLACEIYPKMPFLGLQPNLVAPNSTK